MVFAIVRTMGKSCFWVRGSCFWLKQFFGIVPAIVHRCARLCKILVREVQKVRFGGFELKGYVS